MKKIVLIVMITVLMTGQQTFSQDSNLKIGYVDVDYILSEMPETKQVESELKVHENQLQNQLQAKMQQYQKNLADYQQNYETMADAIRTDKERELTQMQQNIQQFQQDAQVSLQKKSSELLQPIYDKIGKAINDVAEAQNYTYILSTRVGSIDVILFAQQEHDLSDAVLKNMGITPSGASN